MAIGVLKGFQQTGLRVPEDISITGFDNIIYSDYTRPSLTTIDQPKRFLGAEAAKMMFTQLSEGTNLLPRETRVKRLPGRLVIRQSTAAPAEE